MNFDESLKYLYDLGYELSVKKFGLENTIKLLKAIDNPEKKYLKIQVAGTNGKGSVCAFLSSICVEAGINTGLYTSPHLVSITERIKIDNLEISEKDFARQAEKIRNVSETLVDSGELRHLPTFFEQVTAIALNYFAEQEVKIAILETGLGGRFDATTATNAEIVAITPVDFDHQNILGNTLSEIAYEKAAIIGEDKMVVVGEQKAEAQKVISEKCKVSNVIPKTAENVKTTFLRGQVSFQTDKDLYKNIKLGLLGNHQIENAKIAVLLAESLPEELNISKKDIIDGLRKARHPGRLEYWQNYLFDGAHNVSGAKALRNYLDEFIDKPIIMIFGSMRDKDLSEIAGILFSKADKLILTSPENPRSMDISELAEFVPRDFNRENLILNETVTEALTTAEKLASDKHLILVTGSLYLVGEVQKKLR